MQWNPFNCRIQAVRRLLLIIFLVVLGAAIGGGVGVGVAMYFMQRQPQTSQTPAVGSADTTSPQVKPEAAEVVEEIVQKTSSRTTAERGVGGATSQVPRNPDTAKLAVVPPKGGEEEDASPVMPTSGEVSENSQPSTPTSPSLPTTTPTVSPSPTIDLNTGIDLTTPKPKKTPKVPSITPELSHSSPSLSLGGLSESEIKKVYYQEGNLAKAERMLRKELKKNPKSSLARKYLYIIKLEKKALALEAQGDKEGAKRIWRQILKRAPDHPRAKARLSK